MAVKKNAECEIIIKVETGTTSTGKASYSSRSFGYINPSLAEDDILDIGQKIAGLQKYNLGSVNRQQMRGRHGGVFVNLSRDIPKRLLQSSLRKICLKVVLKMSV